MSSTKSSTRSFQTELVAIDTLKPHPRNYRSHPDDQLDHIVKSIEEHGFYRNIVIAKDGTVLAGHGVLMAAKRLKLSEVPVIRLNIGPSDPQALKVLAGDNGIMHLGENDDRALTELLKEIHDVDIDGLLGTGYDTNMLSALVMTTRPTSEIADKNEASQWVGMPDYHPQDDEMKLTVRFIDANAREQFAESIGYPLQAVMKPSIWYPPKSTDDVSSLRIDA